MLTDPSFAPPAHMLGQGRPIPGPGVTALPAGGQAFAQDPRGGTPQGAAIAVVQTVGTGPGNPGQILRVVGTDGSHLNLVWDPINNKWVGEEFGDSFNTTATDASTGTSYAAVLRNGPYREWAVWVNAGLTMEVRTLAPLTAGASSTIFFAAALTGVNAAGAPADDFTNVSAEVSHNTATTTMKDSGWVTLNTSATVKDFISLGPAMKRTGANNGTVANGGSVRHRWVYTP